MSVGSAAPIVLMRACLAPLILCLLAGCMITPGESTLDAELERSRIAGSFSVIEASPTHAVIAARGRRVVVTPSQGSCINEEAIDLSTTSAFLLLTDCTLELGAANGTAVKSRSGERLHMHRAFPGLVTVSVAGEARGTMQSLEAFLVSPDGRDRLARGARGAPVEVAEMRELGDSLFVHARSLDDSLPILSRDFWRAFVEVNGRLVVITASGFEANAISTEEMFAHVLKQVEALDQGNRGTIALSPQAPAVSDLGTARAVTPPEEPVATLVAEEAEVEAETVAAGPKTVRPPIRPTTGARATTPVLAIRSPGPNDPLPPSRPGGRASASVSASAPTPAPSPSATPSSTAAPTAAPLAPKRNSGG